MDGSFIVAAKNGRRMLSKRWWLFISHPPNPRNLADYFVNDDGLHPPLSHRYVALHSVDLFQIALWTFALAHLKPQGPRIQLLLGAARGTMGTAAPPPAPPIIF